MSTEPTSTCYFCVHCKTAMTSDDARLHNCRREGESAAAQPPPDPSPTPWDHSTWGFYCDACKTFFDLLTDGLTVTHENNTCTRYHRCGSQARYIGYDHEVVPPAAAQPRCESCQMPLPHAASSSCIQNMIPTAAETAPQRLGRPFYPPFRRIDDAAHYCCGAAEFDEHEKTCKNYREAVPSAAETAMTAEQDIQQVLDFYNNWHDHSDDFTPDRDTVGLVLAYAAHVREAAQGESCTSGEDWKRAALAANDSFKQAEQRAETAERKLAELGKAADAVIERFKIVTSWPDPHFSKELPIELGSEVAALASLRAGSKEPVD